MLGIPGSEILDHTTSWWLKGSSCHRDVRIITDLRGRRLMLGDGIKRSTHSILSEKWLSSCGRLCLQRGPISYLPSPALFWNVFLSATHQDVASFPLPLTLNWPCDFLWLIEVTPVISQAKPWEAAASTFTPWNIPFWNPAAMLWESPSSYMEASTWKKIELPDQQSWQGAQSASTASSVREAMRKFWNLYTFQSFG